MPRKEHVIGEAGLPHRARAAVVVAHPDDETLWAGGWILDRPDWNWTIVTLCRRGDPDRAPKFRRALERYGASGGMRDMDDGADQRPLEPEAVEKEVLSALPSRAFDVLFTHGSNGEYTRHLRHEETSRAVINLWRAGRLAAGEVWMFAYEDGGRRYLPKAIRGADLIRTLSEHTWNEKYRIITEIYGFAPESWEARTTPRVEAFRRLRSPNDVDRSKSREERVE